MERRLPSLLARVCSNYGQAGCRTREKLPYTRGGAWGPGSVTKGRRFVREGGPRPSARVEGNYGQTVGRQTDETWLPYTRGGGLER